jgi:hypothetical protein
MEITMPLTEAQLAARQAVLHSPDALDCTLYRADENDPEAEELDLGDAKLQFLGPFEAPADWDAAEREEYFGESAPELFINAYIECQAEPGSSGYFTADVGDYVATLPGQGEVLMYFVHDYLEDSDGVCTYVLVRDEEVLE